MGKFNGGVLALIDQLPKNKGYYWIDGFDGSIENVLYDGEVMLKAATDGSQKSYCCGLTLQIYLTIINNYKQNIGNVQAVKNIKRDWFVASGKRKGCVDGLLRYKLGTELTIDQAQPGDFVQLWRSSGSGHSVIYLAHDAKSLTYFSTQPLTNGVGKRTELRVGKNAVSEIYVVRPNEIV